MNIFTTATGLAGHAKSLIYVFLAAVAFLATAASDDALTNEEVLNLTVVVLGAVLVYWVPNLKAGVGRWLKMIIAFAIAGIVAGLSFLTDGVTPSEWMQIILAAFAGVGVYITPNEPAPSASASYQHMVFAPLDEGGDARG
jgi:hypothetical protein